LLPYLPYLIEGGKLVGKKAIEQIGEQTGEAMWESAQALWNKLRGKENIEKVAETVVSVPDNDALQDALIQEIAKVLKNDPSLLQETTRIVSEVETGAVEAGAKVVGVKVKGSGKRPSNIDSKTKTGDVKGTVIGVEIEG